MNEQIPGAGAAGERWSGGNWPRLGGSRVPGGSEVAARAGNCGEEKDLRLGRERKL